MHSLAFLYQEVYHENQKAFKLYKRAAKQNYGLSQFALALIFLQKKQYQQAIHWLKKAIKQKVPDAWFILGSLYQDGVGVRQDYKKAVKLFKQAIKHGVPEAQESLGLMYMEGEDFFQTIKKQKNFCNKLAKMVSIQLNFI